MFENFDDELALAHAKIKVRMRTLWLALSGAVSASADVLISTANEYAAQVLPGIQSYLDPAWVRYIGGAVAFLAFVGLVRAKSSQKALVKKIEDKAVVVELRAAPKDLSDGSL